MFRIKLSCHCGMTFHDIRNNTNQCDVKFDSVFLQTPCVKRGRISLSDIMYLGKGGWVARRGLFTDMSLKRITDIREERERKYRHKFIQVGR